MKHRTVIIIISVIVVLCSFFWILSESQSEKKFAKIYSDGVLIYEVDLNKVTESYELPVTYGKHTNILMITHGEISVSYADCPDRLCQKQGAASNGTYPIVCLPNKMTVVFENSENSDVPNAVSR